MKTIKLLGRQIKEDNGSGYRIADEFPNRKFRDDVVYDVTYNGASLDRSTVTRIERSSDQP